MLLLNSGISINYLTNYMPYTVKESLALLKTFSTLRPGDAIPETFEIDGTAKPVSIADALDALDGEITHVTGESVSRKARIRELESTLTEKNSLIKQLSEVTGSASGNPEDVKSRIADLTQKLADVTEKESKIRELEDKVNNLSDTKTSLENQLHQVTTESKTLTEKLSETEKQYSEVSNQFKKTNKRLSLSEAATTHGLTPGVFELVFNQYEASVGSDVSLKTEDIEVEKDGQKITQKALFFVTVNKDGENTVETKKPLTEIVDSSFSELKPVLFSKSDDKQGDQTTTTTTTTKPVVGGTGKKPEGKKPGLGDSYFTKANRTYVLPITK